MTRIKFLITLERQPEWNQGVFTDLQNSMCFINITESPIIYVNDLSPEHV